MECTVVRFVVGGIYEMGRKDSWEKVSEVPV